VSKLFRVIAVLTRVSGRVMQLNTSAADRVTHSACTSFDTVGR
jgi:hypothetical protein